MLAAESLSYNNKMNVEEAVPKDLPPEIAAQGPHPSWVKMIEMQKKGRPKKFVSRGLMTQCSKCNEWKHLSEFYTRIKANIYVAVDGPPSERMVAYGIPHSYCNVCQRDEVQKSNEAQLARYVEMFGTTAKYLKNYPEPEVIADELRKRYDDVNEDVLQRLVDEDDARSLWGLWDQMAKEGLVLPVKLKGRDR